MLDDLIDGVPPEFLDGFKKKPINDEKLQELIDRVDALENLIKVTFDGHVLIDGQWRKFTTVKQK